MQAEDYTSQGDGRAQFRLAAVQRNLPCTACEASLLGVGKGRLHMGKTVRAVGTLVGAPS